MPTLDVTEAFDPSFLDCIAVLRIVQTIDMHGRAVRYKRRFDNIPAVVTATSPDNLSRLPEYEMMARSITVYCPPPFRLQGPVRSDTPSTGLGDQTHPDHVLYQGGEYLVWSLQNYSSYGRGFTSAICISVESVEPPPAGGSVPDVGLTNLGATPVMGSADD